MAIKLSARQQKTALIVGGLAIGTLAVYFGLILLPMWQRYSDCSAQITSGRQQLGILQTVTAREPQMHQQHRELLESVRLWRERLPRSGNISSVIENISGFATQAGVKLVSVVPQGEFLSAGAAGLAASAAAPKLPYRAIPIQVEASAGYHQLGRFLDLVEQASFPMRISSLRISGNAKEGSRHRIRILIEAYVASGMGAEEPADKPASSG